MENSTAIYSRTSEMIIGKCTYVVTTHFNPNGRETVEDKLFRVVSERVSEHLKSGESTTDLEGGCNGYN